MKTWSRRIAFALGLVVAVLLAIVFFRTLAWKSAQVAVKAIAPIEVDDAAVNRLAGAVKIQTVSVPEAPNADFSAFIVLNQYLEASFPQLHRKLTREVISGDSLLYTWPGSDSSARPILLMAHTDVVPVEAGTATTWTHPPFSGDIADGFVWGRGTLDDKCAVVALLEAVEQGVKKGFQPRQTVFLAFGHDEEIGGQACACQIAKLLDSRKIRLEYVLDEGLAVTDGIVPGLKEKSRSDRNCREGIHERRARGPCPRRPFVDAAANHGGRHDRQGRPQPRRSPHARFIGRPGGPSFRPFGPDMPFLTKIAIANQWLLGSLIIRQLSASEATNALVRTTTAATIIEGGIKENVLPARARAVVNFRIKPGDTIDKVLAHVKGAVADPRVTVKLLDPTASRNASPVSSTTSNAYRTIEQTIRQIFPGALVAPSLVLGATDSREYEHIADDVYRFLPTTIGPDDTKRIHGTDERISVESYQNCVRFYTQLLTNEASE